MMRRMRSSLVHAGRRFFFREAGAGTPLLWLHAFPLSADLFEPQLGTPPPGVRVIAPDFRGFGGSPDEGPLTIEAHAEDIEHVAEALGLGDVVLGGLSMGGYVAFALLRRGRLGVRGLVLADTRAEADTPDAQEGRVRMQRMAREHGAAAVAETLVPRLLGKTTLESRPAVVAGVRAAIERAKPASIVAALECLRTRPDSLPGLGFIAVPTLVVVGDEDVLTPVTVHETLRARIPRAELVVVAQAGHLSNIEQPEAFNASVAAFLAGLPR